VPRATFDHLDRVERFIGNRRDTVDNLRRSVIAVRKSGSKTCVARELAAFERGVVGPIEVVAVSREKRSKGDAREFDALESRKIRRKSRL